MYLLKYINSCGQAAFVATLFYFVIYTYI